MDEVYLRLIDIHKSFGKEKVLDGFSLDVKRGEFLTLLGNSGSGKTTAIRIIAGLEEPDSGRVVLEGTDITDLPPEKRHLNMVFQNYALFEHMTVKENVGYSLKFVKMSRNERVAKVSETLDLVDLAGMDEKLPSQLSGGQKQRVALARAIINRPKMLLLDEPLGALDKNLNERMQVELKKLQKQLGITFIYITHNHEEAVFLSDRIAFIDNGKIVCVDTVQNTLDSDIPFVRKFLGKES